ncbi:MAG: hypothetical protein ACLUE8_16645 [Lachnospiraceae bacterium]
MFLGSAALALFVLGFAFLGCYPGGVSYDAANQWEQAQSGQFNNWHPVFHTLLIWLVTRVYNHYSFAVLVQIVCFARRWAMLRPRCAELARAAGCAFCAPVWPR